MPGRAEVPAALLQGVDRAAFAVSLALRLQGAGISLGFTSIAAFARGMEEVRLDSKSALYWVARTTLVGRHSDLVTFDAVFDAVFSEAVFSLDPHARRHPKTQPAGEDGDAYSPTRASHGSDGESEGLPWVTLPTLRSSSEDALESGMVVPERLPSRLEAVADTPFEELDPDDLALLDGWLDTALGRWPLRRSRRLAPHHAGHNVSVRATLARARRTGYEPMELVRHRPVRRRRRVVMLGDVSQSMQPHAAAYFHLMRSAVLTTGAEVFAFSTSLTRLTPVLAHKSAEVAVERASETVDDRFGGTRIATHIRAL
ncbi:MAG: VWA domain-containing protein, partial [Acidimicrobiales bacterium]